MRCSAATTSWRGWTCRAAWRSWAGCDIGNRIVTAIANQIEVAERNRAILKNPNSLNAWEAHYRGVWHMMRFDREDNEQARHYFQTAVRLDPTLARPRAGLSFTHFQGWHDRGPAIDRAYGAAVEGVMADESDPPRTGRWAARCGCRTGRAKPWVAGRAREAQEVAAAIQRARGSYRVEEFFAAFKLGDEAKARVREAAGVGGAVRVHVSALA